MSKNKATQDEKDTTKDSPEDIIKFTDGDFGERTFLRQGEGYREVSSDKTLEKKNFHRNRRYTFTDLQSFITYCGLYGDPKQGIIFYNPSEVIMYLGEKNREESVQYNFTLSQELMLFLGREGKSRSFFQKDLYKCLSSYPESFEPADIVPKIRSLKISASIEIQSEIGDSEHKFLFQEKNGKQTCSLPKEVVLEIPYFDGSKHIIKIKTGLEVIKPQSSDEKVTFVLENTYYDKIKAEALKQEIDFMKHELNEWTFLKGMAN